STPIAAATADPIVVVQNGNGRPGSAGAVAEALSVAGFEVADATNATRDDHGTTLVVARPTALTSAERIREALGYGSVMTGSVPSGIDVVVIVGLDAPAP
ncbi:MAG TPA: LytR C-terminal domain-containing protein, partial [Acidimicrobiia bacterium]|nr:LytR C-terminal domain-containing protein [Acidimicrobiia bacterium]